MFKKCMVLVVLVSSLGSLRVSAVEKNEQHQKNYQFKKRAKVAGYYVLQGHAGFMTCAAVLGSIVVSGASAYKSYEYVDQKGVFRGLPYVSGCAIMGAHFCLVFAGNYIGHKYLYKYWQKKREAVEAQID